MTKRKSSKFVYHGSLGKYATLEKVMGKHKEVHLKKEKGYIDIYIPKSEDVYECPNRACRFTSKTREGMFAHIRKTGHGSYKNSIPKRASKFLK